MLGMKNWFGGSEEKTVPTPELAEDNNVVEITHEQLVLYINTLLSKRGSKLKVGIDNAERVLERSGLIESQISALVAFAESGRMPDGKGASVENLKTLDYFKSQIEMAIERVNKKTA